MNIINAFQLVALQFLSSKFVFSCEFGVYDNADSDGYAAANGWTIMHVEDLSVNYTAEFVNYMISNNQQIQVINTANCAIVYGDDDGTNEWISIIAGNYLVLSAGCNIQLNKGEKWYIDDNVAGAPHIIFDGTEVWNMLSCCGTNINKSPAIFMKGCTSVNPTDSSEESSYDSNDELSQHSVENVNALFVDNNKINNNKIKSYYISVNLSQSTTIKILLVCGAIFIITIMMYFLYEKKSKSKTTMYQQGDDGADNEV